MIADSPVSEPSSGEVPAPSRSPREGWWLYLGALAAALWVFAPTRSLPFTFDDLDVLDVVALWRTGAYRFRDLLFLPHNEHLIPAWRSVLAEVVRVVGPGGLFLANLGAYDGPRHEIQERFAEITGIPIEPVGLNWGAEDELDAEMARHGAQVRELEALVQGGEETMGSFIDEIRENSYSWTWRVPDDVRLRAADEIEPWARERFGDLDAVRRWELAVIWRAYDLP